jgi:hypothetical protein
MPFENIAAASLFRTVTPYGDKADAVTHAISLVEKAIIQQVNGASDTGRLFSWPALSHKASSRAPASRQNCPPP